MSDLQKALDEAFTPMTCMLPEVMCRDVKLPLTVVECRDPSLQEVPVAKEILHGCKLAIWRAGATEGEHWNFTTVSEVSVNEAHKFWIGVLRTHPFIQGVN
jgi:hypothetical protein